MVGKYAAMQNPVHDMRGARMQAAANARDNEDVDPEEMRRVEDGLVEVVDEVPENRGSGNVCREYEVF